MRSLHRRLLLSHILPVLLSLPLVGFAFIYILQTQVLFANLTSDLTSQAVLIAELTTQRSSVWLDPGEAGDFAGRIGELLPAALVLIDPQARLIASSEPNDAQSLGQIVAAPGLEKALAGDISLGLSDIQSGRSDMAIVFVPVFSPSQRLIGVVGLAQRFSDVYNRFRSLRAISIGVVFAILLLGGGLGLILALHIERPIRSVTDAVQDLSRGDMFKELPMEGPEEVRGLQVAFNRLVNRLRELEDTRRHLLANLVHELGRPLGAMLSAVQALQSGAGEDVSLRQELLDGVEGEIHRLRRLTNDLVRLHEQLLGPLELMRAPTEVEPWLSTVLAPWREAALAKELEWDVAYACDLPVITVDADRLAQALENIVSNAIQYTPAGGKIRISAGADGEELWIRVRDNGRGISPEEQGEIFAPFYRGVSASRFPRGMGLGLSIARELVTAHGGWLSVESDIGKGSTFTIHLPLDGFSTS